MCDDPSYLYTCLEFSAITRGGRVDNIPVCEKHSFGFCYVCNRAFEAYNHVVICTRCDHTLCWRCDSRWTLDDKQCLHCVYKTIYVQRGVEHAFHPDKFHEAGAFW